MKKPLNQSASLPQDILAERARLLARPPEETKATHDSLELVTFHLEHEYFGISTSLVYETQPLKTLHWCRVPGAPRFIIGAVNLRGHIYSITDLAGFLGLPLHPISDHAHILLLRGGRCADGKEMELTLLTDDVPVVHVLPLSALNPPPLTVSIHTREYLQGITPDMLMVLNMQRLLSDPRLIVQESY